MHIELERQLIYAFANGNIGGNPSLVIATSGSVKKLEDKFITIAKKNSCEVTHINVESGKSILRFYVSEGEISYCGHGIIAAAAWLFKSGFYTNSITLFYNHGKVKIQAKDNGYFGFLEPAGNKRQIELKQTIIDSISSMLKIDYEISSQISIWIGGGQRLKALIRLPDQSYLKMINVSPALRDEFCEKYSVTGIYLYANDNNGNVWSRHFPIYAGNVEDMATGNIAATVAELVFKNGDNEIVINQGGPYCNVSKLKIIPKSNKKWLVIGYCRISSVN